MYKYCTNCTFCTRTVLIVVTQKLLLHVQLHNSTAHLLYKLYSLQMNCTYSSYTQAAATCSSAQPHKTFIVKILYKPYSLQLIYTYSNYTEAAVTCSDAQQHSTFTYKYCTNCTVCNWTVLTVITQKLLLHVQLHNSTAHLLYKYCTNCTVCNWSILTVITKKLLLSVQLHNRRESANLMSSEAECWGLLHNVHVCVCVCV